MSDLTLSFLAHGHLSLNPVYPVVEEDKKGMEKMNSSVRKTRASQVTPSDKLARLLIEFHYPRGREGNTVARDCQEGSGPAGAGGLEETACVR
jgi:hypothetical protein